MYNLIIILLITLSIEILSFIVLTKSLNHVNTVNMMTIFKKIVTNYKGKKSK